MSDSLQGLSRSSSFISGSLRSNSIPYSTLEEFSPASQAQDDATSSVAHLSLGMNQEEYELHLRKKIHKASHEPSKTGLNLYDAERIDTYVSGKIGIWKQQLGEPDCTGIYIKKSEENRLTRSIYIALTGVPHIKVTQRVMQVMVLCKTKVSATEHPDKDVASKARPDDDPLKAFLFGEGRRRRVKRALEWITGQIYTEAVPIKNLPVETNPTRTPYALMMQEFYFMGLVGGMPGIVKPATMMRELPAPSQGHSAEQRYSFFMHAYAWNLSQDVEIGSDKSFIMKRELVLMIKDVAQGLLTLFNKDIIYNDSKSANTLFDHDASLILADLEMCMLKDNYLERLRKSETICGTLAYLAPEMCKYRSTGQLCDEIAAYPFARDMWAAGLQVFVIACHKFQCQDSPALGLIRFLDKESKKTDDMIREGKNPIKVYYEAFDGIVDPWVDDLTKHINTNVVEEKPKRLGLALVTIIRDMLQADPRNRITPPTLMDRLNKL